MSDFNTANDLASQLLCGRTYQGNEPCFKPTKIVFRRGLDSGHRVVVEDDGKSDWGAVASRIQTLLGQGYHYATLPCGYCGATELENVLHCDNCGEGVDHGDERPFVNGTGDKGTLCGACNSDPDLDLEDLL